jgi:hypothetical protein
VISTIAGTGTGSYSGDGGQATSATVNSPHGIALDSSGNVFFSDYNNHRVRKITVSTGIITTYAGTGSGSYSGDGGVASSAALTGPNGLAIDSSGTKATSRSNTFITYSNLIPSLLGNVYISDFSNNRIRKVVASSSIISTIAGTGSAGYSSDGGQATSAALNCPVGVAVDTSGKWQYLN